MEVTQSSPYQSIKLLQAPHNITTTIYIYLVFFNCWKMQGENKECDERFLVFFLKCRRRRQASWFVVISLFFFSNVEDGNELRGSSSSVCIFFKCRRWWRVGGLVVISWFFFSSAKDDDEPINSSSSLGFFPQMQKTTTSREASCSSSSLCFFS